MKSFFAKIGIKQINSDLYAEALTHNSYSNENRRAKNYQRLEFLGDAILQQKVSEYLFKNYPKSNEGILTKYRSSIVRQETLAKLSRAIGLGNYIRLGIGEHEAKGYEKDTILADVYESVTAAIYLDLGNDALNNWLNQTIFNKNNLNNFLDSIRDFKSELQELIQIDKRSDLSYIIANQEKIHENKILFTVNCILDGMIYGIGEGFNKKQAEQQAAKNALSKIKTVKNIK
ncbi:ribonuclease III [Spiroplasma gladiatoris]|uniref:Ribonuclease 3 n=1 Tax=Spiroplasma gladiatoris TaxID=2143 RepID=A0A4P7AK07_9MOLU|nr:ribonuclease III [Spiroplasma gladiatoris]QBQ08006.1 ribonuclease III [Spiroplasma gladiatoris]